MEKRTQSIKIFIVMFMILVLTGIVTAQYGDNTDTNPEDTDSNLDNTGTQNGDEVNDDIINAETSDRLQEEGRDGVRGKIRTNKEEYKTDINDLKVNFRGDIGALRTEAKEILKGIDRGDLSQQEKEEVRAQLRALRIEAGELRVEYRDEAKNRRVQYRGEFKALMEEFREGHKHRTRSGRDIEVKIMPSVASETAIARLKLKVCNEENDCTIEFKEVGEGDNTKIRYELKAKKEGRFLGIFKVKMNVESEVDAESGEVVRARKPWWAILVNE